MKQLNFEEACKLIGKKDTTLVNQDQEPITTWPQFFMASKYFLSSSATSTLKHLHQ